MKETKTADPTDGMTVEEEIEYARENGWNLLLPTTNIGGLSEFHKPVTDKVTLSPDPKDKDVYPGKADGDTPYFRIHAQGLYKLSLCAGIQWDPMQCRRTDDRTSRDYVSYGAVGGIRKADGTMLWVPGEFDLDLEVEEEEIFLGHFNRAKTWNKSDGQKKAFVRDSTKRDVLHKRKHKLKLAETGAMNRVVRKILALKPQYSREELLKPFLVIRIVLQPNFNDREFRQRMMDASIQAITGIYGAPPVPRLLAPMVNDVIELPLAEGPTDDKETPPATGRGEKPTEEEVFAGYSKEEQIKTLKSMAKKKGYALADLKFPVEEFTDTHRADFFEILNGMEDIKTDDDIPF